MTPRKKNAFKLKKRIDDSFLRRSKKLAKKYESFKNEESAKKAREDANVTTVENVEPDEPMPLDVIPRPAPHLSKEIIEGIAHGFLQIQPKVVSTALLDKDDLDE